MTMRDEARVGIVGTSSDRGFASAGAHPGVTRASSGFRDHHGVHDAAGERGRDGKASRHPPAISDPVARRGTFYKLSAAFLTVWAEVAALLDLAVLMHRVAAVICSRLVHTGVRRRP